MDTGKCCDCGAETCLFVNGVPICVVCDAKRDKVSAFPIPTPLRPREGRRSGDKPDMNPPKASVAAA